MNKTSARDIQLFVAGALALIGFQALILLPYYLTASMDLVRALSGIIAGLALPIGICMLTGRAKALLFAQIYLWLLVITGCLVLPVYCWAIPARAKSLVLRVAPEMITAIILLWLIFWSRSRKPGPEPESKTVSD
jgi:hypothetical protein